MFARKNRVALLGLLCGGAASFIWGASFLYWRELRSLSPQDLVSFRILFSLMTLVLIVPFIDARRRLVEVLTQPATWMRYGLAGLVVALNWGMFIFASIHSRPFDASLGYFLVPLVNVIFGVLFLREKLNVLQYSAIGFASAGVLILLLQPGEFWITIPLTIGLSFGIYGYIKKTGKLDALTSMYPETIALSIPAFLWLVFGSQTGFSVLHASPSVVMLLAGTGVLSIVPLLLFSIAVRRLQLATLGLIQYLNPLTQFIIGLVLFSRPASTEAIATFSLIGVALSLISWDSIRKSRT